jgi:hypothetical protein
MKNTNSFLPANYTVPTGGSQFMKLVKGDNRIRILSEPVLGFEWWEEIEEGRKPFRVKTFEEAVKNGHEPIKHFWALVVYNYETKDIQVLELTQKTILRAIETYSRDEDWGDPRDYDIVIKRSGEGLETEYQVIAKPKKELDKSIKDAYSDSDIKLEALFEGKYPVENKEETLSDKEVDEVNDKIPF